MSAADAGPGALTASPHPRLRTSPNFSRAPRVDAEGAMSKRPRRTKRNGPR